MANGKLLPQEGYLPSKDMTKEVDINCIVYDTTEMRKTTKIHVISSM